MTKKKPKISIVLIVEGQTEENYLKAFFNDYFKDDFAYTTSNLESGNYIEAYKHLSMYRGMNKILFIVMDLDRANNVKERENLEKLCQALYKYNKFNNIFLTYKDFETFLTYHFLNKTDIKNVLKTDSDKIKNNKNIYDTIKRNGGSYDNVINNFHKNNLCYNKIDSTKPSLDISKLNLIQSGLMNFKEYCIFLKKNFK